MKSNQENTALNFIQGREYKGVIFDLDGVLVDTAIFHFKAWRSVAFELGMTLSEKDNEKLKGVSRDAAFDIILSIAGKTLDNETKRIYLEKKNERYLSYLLQMSEADILPGVLAYISYLRKHKVKIALGSASKNAVYVLEKVRLLQEFDIIIDGNGVNHAKPDPLVFTEAARKLELSTDDCVVFEDSSAGIEAANRAGIFSIGVGERSNLLDAKLIVSDFPELLNLLSDC